MNNFHEAIAYLDKIDEAYATGKLDGISRYSMEWSMFSREMNIEIHKKIKSDHPEKLLFKMILPYPMNANRSEKISAAEKRMNPTCLPW